MLTFMFWNLNKKPIEQLVADAVHENHVDILILAECEISIPNLLFALNQNDEVQFQYCTSPNERIKYFTKFPSELLQIVSDSVFTSIRKYVPQDNKDIIIAGVHSRSKRYSKSEDQPYTAIELSESIKDAEQKYGHMRTIVIGDFNMNPFEQGMVSSKGLHAIMDRDLVKKVSRTVEGKQYDLRYNPMWSLMGDLSNGPTGTYYYNDANHVNYYWNTLDQVLIGVDLIDQFVPESLKVLTEIIDVPLLTNGGIPNTSIASDHLPICFQLEV